MTIWASVTLSATWGVFCQDLLAREWGIASTPASSVTTDIAVHVANVVFIVFVELVVCLKLKRLAPKYETVLHGKPNAFEEKRVLETTEVLQMAILPQRHMQIAHAKGKLLGQGVDGRGINGRARQCGVRV